jgi:hypothetical protein
LQSTQKHINSTGVEHETSLLEESTSREEQLLERIENLDKDLRTKSKVGLEDTSK